MRHNTIVMLVMLIAGGNGDKLRTIYEWKRLEFDYDNATMAAHLASGFYNPDKVASIDADVYYSCVLGIRRVFLTIPRFEVGSPCTLVEVVEREGKGPVLVPYPSIEWQDTPEQCKPNRLVSVYRTKVDQCGRLWVLDSGRYNDELICRPQIIAFNMETNAVVYRFEFTRNLYTENSEFVTPTVEIRNGNCNDFYLYMADVSDYALVVYSSMIRRGWLVKDKTMASDPTMTTITIQGTSFNLTDGIMGMDVGHDGWQYRKLYYSALNNNKMTSVSLSQLRNQNLFWYNPSSSPEIFRQYPTGRPSQSAGMSIDREGIAYFGLMTQTSINCWNTRSEDFGPYISTVYVNEITMQFPGGVKVIRTCCGKEELWVMTSRFQKYSTDTYNFNEINFRISVGKIPDILNGTKCAHPNNA